jgi:ATP-dependent protease ClpP protease subunit
MIFSSKNLTIVILILTGLIFSKELQAKDLQHIELKEDNFLNLTGMIVRDLSIKTKQYLDKHQNDKEILIYINSSGGLVDEGLFIIDLLKKSNKKIVCIGKTAMSMGMYIFQSCNVRYVVKNSVLMTHGMLLKYDNFVSLKDVAKEVLELAKQDEDLHKIIENKLHITKEQLLANENPMWFITGSTQILKFHAADKEVDVSCSKEIQEKFNIKYMYEDGIGKIADIYPYCPF